MNKSLRKSIERDLDAKMPPAELLTKYGEDALSEFSRYLDTRIQATRGRVKKLQSDIKVAQEKIMSLKNNAGK